MKESSKNRKLDIFNEWSRKQLRFLIQETRRRRRKQANELKKLYNTLDEIKKELQTSQDNAVLLDQYLLFNEILEEKKERTAANSE